MLSKAEADRLRSLHAAGIMFRKIINPISMNCLTYARVSTDKQVDRDLSIPAQLQAMRQYAAQRDWSILEEFVETGMSARTADRPGLRCGGSQSMERTLPGESSAICQRRSCTTELRSSSPARAECCLTPLPLAFLRRL